MNNKIERIKLQFKDCSQCIEFLSTRLLFVVLFGFVLGTAGSQAVEGHPSSKLFHEVKAETVVVVHNDITITDKR